MELESELFLFMHSKIFSVGQFSDFALRRRLTTELKNTYSSLENLGRFAGKIQFNFAKNYQKPREIVQNLRHKLD